MVTADTELKSPTALRMALRGIQVAALANIRLALRH